MRRAKMASRKGVGPTANIGGHPITERHTTPEEWLNPAFDLTEVIRTLSRVGAVTVPGVLRDTERQRLIEQTVRLPFTDQPAVVGSYDVQQHYAAMTEFALGSVFRQLWDAFQTLLEQQVARLPCSPFASPLRFTNAALHRYPPGPLGLSPHRDSARSINLVAIFVLRGRGRFIVCQDRTGRGAVDLPNAPGDLLLLRAPGFLNTEDRPFHAVLDIFDERLTFVLRQGRE
jgi:hypothetical protein